MASTALRLFDEATGGDALTEQPRTNTSPLVALDLFDQATGGVNAPPSTITATPHMTAQGLHGRTDLQGQPIQLDQDTGIPVSDYWHIAFQSDPQSRAEALQKLYPDKKVRVLDTGDVTLEVTDSETGQLKDVTINPRGVSKEDFIDLAAQTPELAASMAVALATGGSGILRTLAQIVASSGAGAAAGAAKDVATRGTEGISVRPGDIASDRGAQALMDMAGQAVFGAVGKSTRALSPFATKPEPGSLAFNLRSGVDFLKRNYGIEFETTPAMRTGSSALAAVEAAESPLPGSRTVMDRLRNRFNKDVQEAVRMAQGAVPSEEAVGKQAVGELADRIVRPVDNALQEAQRVAIQKGDQRVLDLLDEAIGVPRGASRVSVEEAGEVTRQAFDRRMLRAQEAVDKAYAEVNALPGGTGDVLSGDAAASVAAEIRRELPAVVKQVERPTGLLDEGGQPVTREVTVRQELPSGKPEGLEKALTDLEALKGGKVSLQTLTNLKNSAYEAISAFRNAHPDVKDRWFNKIASAYERGIQEGIDATENLALKDALAKARDTYKRELVPLERPGLRELAKGEFDTGQLSPEQITDRLFEGPRAWKNYTMLRETLGENNMAFRALKRAWVDTKVAAATDDVLGTIDTGKLASTLKKLNVDHPELAQELLGSNYQKLQQALTARGAMEKIDNLDPSTLRTLLNVKDPTVADLRNLAGMAAKRDKAYVNGILKDISDGLPLDDLRPTEFISRIRNAKTPTTEVQDILTNLNPQTRQAIASAEMYRILQQASTVEGETAARALAADPTNISAKKVVEALGSGDERARSLLLLGPDLQAPVAPSKGATPPKLPKDFFNRAETLEALVNVVAPREASKTAFAGAGSIGATTTVHTLMRSPLRYATSYAKNMFAALAYTRGFGRALTNAQFDAEASAIAANTLIASEPFVRASMEAFGSETTKKLIADLKGSIDRSVVEFNNSPQGRRRAATRQFIQGGQVPMQMGVE